MTIILSAFSLRECEYSISRKIIVYFIVYVICQKGKLLSCKTTMTLFNENHFVYISRDSSQQAVSRKIPPLSAN